MFAKYYSRYLALDAGREIFNCLVCPSPDRDTLLNRNFAYKIIITDYSGKRIVSVSPSISANIINNICTAIIDCSFEDILQLGQLHETGYRISMMYRMTLNRNKAYANVLRSQAVEYISEYKKYVIRDSGNIVSYCKVSNIDYGYGNIVVWTDEKYRRKGYARELLYRIISMCESEGIVPVYIVDSQNSASIELAKSAGFEIVQTEIIGCAKGGVEMR